MADRKKLDRQVPREIPDYLEERIGKAADPLLARRFGRSKFGWWRYGWRDDRILCRLRGAKLTVRVRSIGHRGRVDEE